MNQTTSVEAIKALLQRHPALKALSGPAWDGALAEASLTRIPPDSSQTTKCSKAPGEQLTIVLEGAVRVSSLSIEGRTLSICRVQAGELCMLSLAAIYARERLLVDLTPEGNVLMLHIPACHLPILLTHSEAFRTYLMSSMSKHVATLLTRIEETTFGCLKSRILSHLRDMRSSTGCSVIAVSHQELADELGNTREAVSRTLKEIERGGAVKLGRRMISLVAD